MWEIIALVTSLAVIYYKYRKILGNLAAIVQTVYSNWGERRKYKVSAQNEGKKQTVNKEKNEGVDSTCGQSDQLTYSFRNRHLRYEWNQTTFQNMRHSRKLDAWKIEHLNRKEGGETCLYPSCSRCLPMSRKSFVDDPVHTLGTFNLLQQPMNNFRKSNWLVRRFPYVSQALRFHQPFIRTNISAAILQHEKVINAVNQAAAEEREVTKEAYVSLLRKHATKAKQLLQTMAAKLSKLTFGFAGWLALFLLNRMLVKVQFNKGQAEVLKRASNLPHPLIFLPTHWSHLDYIIISLFFFIHGINAPLIAAGENLRIPIIGSLLRGVGASFIKRKLDKKDHVYRAILNAYVEKSLAAGQNMEFFMEGGRSRTGKTNIPKVGLLSGVVNAFMDNQFEDAYIVPIAIKYDKLVDGNFVSEELGNTKPVESLWATLKAVWRVANSNYGSVKVNILQPFSLKEFVQSAQASRHLLDLPEPTTLKSSQIQQPIKRFSSVNETDYVTEQHLVVEALAKHVCYDQSHSTAVMSTNLLAFLMLTKYRQGATFHQVEKCFTWLREQLRARGREVGFDGDSAVCIESAVDLLGKTLIARTVIDSVDDASSNHSVTLKPVTELPHVIEVAYYSNAVISTFLMESIVANALYALLDKDLATSRNCDSQMTVSLQQLIEKAEVLCDILQFEFIFAPPCMTLTSAIIDAVEKFIGNELLSTVDNPIIANTENKREKKWLNLFTKRMLCNTDSEDEDQGFKNQQLKVTLTEERLEQLEFFRSILSPFIESYWVTACNLPCLGETQMEEKSFMKKTRLDIYTRITSGSLLFNECISAGNLSNAIKLFQSWKVVESCEQGGVRLLSLADEYKQEEQLADIVAAIEEFKK